MKAIKLKVNTNLESYQIIIGSNLIKNLNQHLNKNKITFNQCLLVIDNNVPNKMISKITSSLKKKKVSKFIFKANEKFIPMEEIIPKLENLEKTINQRDKEETLKILNNLVKEWQNQNQLN